MFHRATIGALAATATVTVTTTPICESLFPLQTSLPTETCVFQVMGVTTIGTPTVRLTLTLGMDFLGTSLLAVRLRSRGRKVDRDGLIACWNYLCIDSEDCTLRIQVA